MAVPEAQKRIHKQKFPEGKSRLIDVNELSHRTGKAKSTIWADVARGEFIKPIRVKRGVTRWLESDVDEWIINVVEADR
jgi:prophage regulatory protein